MRPVFQRGTIRRTNTMKNALTRCASASSALADLRVVDAANEASALVGGAWVRTARTFAVVDPGSGAPICDVADCGPEQARAAVDAAAAALPAWAGTTARERSDALREWHRRILAASEDIATLMTAECGKPLAEARGEVAYGASFAGQQKRANFPTSKAPFSAVFHSFRLLFGRAIISRSGLDAWALFPERARAEHSR
jgi:succinate-semialdehyde dehydrogenase/glutarate-semialdehyde dehydrogenase